MFRSQDAKVLGLIRDRLNTLLDVKKIILFGSRATGRDSQESDYDVLVIAETDIPFIERQGMALLALGKRDFSLDLLVYTPQEADEAARIPGSAIYWARLEGQEYVA